MNKERLFEISSLLANYSIGNFSEKVEVSDKLDEIDSIIMGINMLGEELEDTTISKNIFENIFNSVSNILFIVNKNGVIVGTNEHGKQIKSIKLNKTLFSSICNVRSKDNSFLYLTSNMKTQFESEFVNLKNKIIYTQTSSVKLSSQTKDGEYNYLVIAEDITNEKEHNLQIIKTIISTQENERKRVADDLHDSLGQELSSTRMMLSALSRDNISPLNLNIIDTCNSILEKSISELRSICFNLMPATLESKNLIVAINELINNTLLEIKLTSNTDTLMLEKEENLAIYRVFQEFLNNSSKHAKASLVKIKINLTIKKLKIELSDNGSGFNINSTKSKGRGLMTMKNRIESIDGQFLFESQKGIGTTLKIEIKC
jgi:signal transduction histidine kinase